MTGGLAKGRPRDPQIDSAILRASLDVLADRGFARFTVEEVAASAGIGKTTIYRRFPDKDSLITHALDHINDDLPPIPEHGSARDRLSIMMERVRQGIPTSQAGRIMRHVLSESQESPQLVAEFYRRVIEPRSARIRTVLIGGKSTGELPEDFDIDVAIAALVGSMVFLSTWAGCQSVDSTSTADVVDLVLR
ncbi:MAG: TetR/AcrR family transcriptional regulator [Candidatus Nanopelagicales bacterium]